MQFIAEVIYIFLIGLAFGSFVTVLVNRTHNEESWWNGRSKCPNCKHVLSWQELIPIFSFIFQKGKCKHCKTRISFQYPIIEFASGVIPVLLFLKMNSDLNLQFLLLFLIFELLIACFVSDLFYMELPDIFTIPAIILAIIYQILSQSHSFNSIIFGAIFGFLFFLVQFLLTKGKGLGSGDIRLGILIGVLLGWPLTLISIMISYVIGSFLAIFLIAIKKLSFKSAVPLGIFLIPGLMIVFAFQKFFLNFAGMFIFFF